MYMSAPSSPTRFSSPNNLVHFYSARTSPHQMESVLEDVNTNFDDFEFETSKRFRQEGYSELQRRPTFETFVPMAFADELFSNGHVVPLKPPPHLNYCFPNANSNKSSSTSSSPNPVRKTSFPRWKNTWNDEFDPFAVALEKVKEEKRGKSHHHRRSRSLSPFRTTTPPLQDQNKQGDLSLELMKHQMGPNSPQENDPKKSSQMVVSPKGPPNKLKGLPFGKKVRPLKARHEGTMKAVEESETLESSKGENKEQKGKGFLGKENNEVKVMTEQVAALWKKYWRGKLKENAHKSTNKEIVEEPKVEITPYRPRFGLCLSFRMESTRNMYSP